MRTPPRRHLAVAATLLFALAASFALTPREKISAQHKIDLESMIPKQFGDWRGVDAPVPLITPPDIVASLKLLYSQTLARTYINSHGERIMLSVAYGGDQSDGLQAHRPEVCYYAQGFRVSDPAPASVSFSSTHIPVEQLVATQGARIEPITYWITVGDTAIAGKIQQKLAQLRYGLTGRIPDGILVRVSSIGRDNPAAYRQHAEFIQAMLAGMPDADRVHLIGARQL